MQVVINTNLKIDDEPSFVKRILVVRHALIEDNLDIICIKQMVNYHTARTTGGKLNRYFQFDAMVYFNNHQVCVHVKSACIHDINGNFIPNHQFNSHKNCPNWIIVNTMLYCLNEWVDITQTASSTSSVHHKITRVSMFIAKC